MTKTSENVQESILIWEVVHGKKLGRKLWFRTANVKAKVDNIMFWVYRVNILVKGKLYRWAWTLLNDSSVFEVHIFDFDEDIYGEIVQIFLIYRLRCNQKFDGLDALKEAISNDVEKLKEEKVTVMSFWTFDHVHPGHSFYLTQAKKFWDELIAVVARDKSVQKFKWKMPLNSEQQRIIDVENLNIADKVILGHDSDYYKCIDEIQPKVIALGYDQKSANIWLENYLKKHKLDISIKIMPPFKELVYKSSKLKNA